MSRRDAFDCVCLLLQYSIVITTTHSAFTKMQESAQARGDRYAILQRTLEHLERVHADDKKQV
jgi:hypothetical protein